MRSEIEHTPGEARLWKILDLAKRLLAWVVLIVSAPMTIYLGIEGISAALNGIRDWWHYIEPSPRSDDWLYFIMFFGAGLCWIFSYAYISDPFSKTERFHTYLRSKRADEARWAKQRRLEQERERTRWEKLRDGFFLVYGVMMVLGLIAVLVKSAF